ncbi:hypothetical protein [Metabacillus dongyingensis]|uniref:hypothetical protein n=1 Tax=Metabacillus dongyingensis TaxID=2874282 RepID=UPI001CBE7EF6|nr:hypothetical protein [Metabacillus dongyingensis]UAL53604.1 hypothetical protein K8L98_07420 [Metabacillus dongyingensis]
MKQNKEIKSQYTLFIERLLSNLNNLSHSKDNPFFILDENKCELYYFEKTRKIVCLKYDSNCNEILYSPELLLLFKSIYPNNDHILVNKEFISVKFNYSEVNMSYLQDYNNIYSLFLESYLLFQDQILNNLNNYFEQKIIELFWEGSFNKINNFINENKEILHEIFQYKFSELFINVNLDNRDISNIVCSSVSESIQKKLEQYLQYIIIPLSLEQNILNRSNYIKIANNIQADYYYYFNTFETRGKLIASLVSVYMDNTKKIPNESALQLRVIFENELSNDSFGILFFREIMNAINYEGLFSINVMRSRFRLSVSKKLDNPIERFNVILIKLIEHKIVQITKIGSKEYGQFSKVFYEESNIHEELNIIYAYLKKRIKES